MWFMPSQHKAVMIACLQLVQDTAVPTKMVAEVGTPGCYLNLLISFKHIAHTMWYMLFLQKAVDTVCWLQLMTLQVQCEACHCIATRLRHVKLAPGNAYASSTRIQKCIAFFM